MEQQSEGDGAAEYEVFLAWNKERTPACQQNNSEEGIPAGTQSAFRRAGLALDALRELFLSAGC